jgi:hypothetical protein
MIEETDILELITGEPSKKKSELKQKEINKSIEKNENFEQQVK